MQESNSNQQLMTFSFDGMAKVRIVQDEHGEPWFVASDVCEAMGIANTSLAVNGNPTREDGGIDADDRGVVTVNTLGGDQQLLSVNESGLYALIFKSRRPEAKRFKKWVTSEVLPSIRRTGSYGQSASNDPMDLLGDPNKLRQALLGYTEKVIALEAKIEVDAPKVGAYERLVKSDGLLNLTNAAKALQIEPSKVFKYLRTNRWVYRRPGAKSDVAYQDKIEAGLLTHKTYVATREDGTERICEQVMVTPKGLAKLAEKIERRVAA